MRGKREYNGSKGKREYNGGSSYIVVLIHKNEDDIGIFQQLPLDGFCTKSEFGVVWILGTRQIDGIVVSPWVIRTKKP